MVRFHLLGFSESGLCYGLLAMKKNMLGWLRTGTSGQGWPEPFSKAAKFDTHCGVTSFPAARCTQSVCFDLFLWARQPSRSRAERQQAAPCHTKDKQPPSQSTGVVLGGVAFTYCWTNARAWLVFALGLRSTLRQMTEGRN